jgi:hypothetical protein
MPEEANLHSHRRENLKPYTVKEEILHYSSQFSACFGVHSNDLVVILMA